MIENEAVKIEFSVENDLIKNAADIYKYCNTERFNRGEVFSCFANTLNMIAKAHKQKEFTNIRKIELTKMKENKKVLVLFSAGLDSVYQAVNLRNKGYEVTLFHMCNQNKYTNGQEEKVAKLFAQKYNFPIIYGKFSAPLNGKFVKFWQENSWKNFLLYTMARSYCLKNEIGNISSGDDLRLSITDAVVGTNLSDSKELTTTFMKDMNINFIPCDGDKELRLKFIFDNNLQDDFYSCVGPGRTNQHWREHYIKKYGTEVEQYNCCACRKCSMHLLLRKYYLHNIELNPEFEDKLWKKLSIGADNVFFDLSIPLEKRIQNLKDY